jgi:Xaa-Pro aminopeptidase
VITRLKKIRSVFAQKNIDAFLVLKDVNIAYLTGFPASESWFLISPHQAFYITDFRYILEAQKGLNGISVHRYTKSIYETFFKLINKANIKRVGIDERHLTLSQYRTLMRQRPKGVQFVKVDHLVENFREIKEGKEIKQIKKALLVHREAHQFLKRIIKAKISEQEVLLKLEHFVKSRGAGFSFDPIVASGPNSCYPHARVTKRRVRNNEPVLIDMGIDVEGYKSDLTRMFFLGKIPKLVKQINNHVYEAQQRAIAKIKAGVLIADVDCAARNYLAENGLAEYFGHALGHGVGLEIHESPRIAQNNSAVLKEGMVITVEPAVYLPEKFGIRIEDMALVTKKGCKVLSDDIH